MRGKREKRRKSKKRRGERNKNEERKTKNEGRKSRSRRLSAPPAGLRCCGAGVGGGGGSAAAAPIRPQLRAPPGCQLRSLQPLSPPAVGLRGAAFVNLALRMGFPAGKRSRSQTSPPISPSRPPTAQRGDGRKTALGGQTAPKPGAGRRIRAAFARDKRSF